MFVGGGVLILFPVYVDRGGWFYGRAAVSIVFLTRVLHILNV